MGILDEAIREHLELKRQHGADDSELKQLEDEAFGPPGRPGDEEQVSDAVAEAPTEFMAQPGAGKGEEEAEAPEPRREPPSIADLQEPPPLPGEEPAPSAAPEPAEEEHPAMEHEAVTEPSSPSEPEPAELSTPAGPSTEERHVIAEQPTEMFDVDEELAAEDDAPPSPTDEELIEEEITEPRLAPTDPLAGLDEGGEVSVEGPAPDDDVDEDDDDFWDERRLSDELDQALEAPSGLGDELEDDEPEGEDEDEEDDEEHEPAAEEPAEVEAEAESEHHSEDVLEETPDFLEETPEDDQLWFEQKPPKDFDFDD